MTGETFFQLHYHLTDTERLFDLAQGIAARRRWLKKHDARCRSFTWYARGLLRRGIAFLILAAVLASRLSKHIIKPVLAIDLEHPEDSDTYEELTPLLSRIKQQNQTIAHQKGVAEDFRCHGCSSLLDGSDSAL